MEHFFHKVLREVEHYYHKFKKHIPHHHVIETFFASKNVRLATILIITAAIPLTVIAVQQVQDIRQSAAGETCENIKNACTGEVTVDKLCAPKGEKIVFSKADGTAFNMDRYHFGNGAKNCTATGNTVTCDAVGTGGKNKPVSHHTVTRDQIDVCKFGIQWKESEKAKPTARPSKGSPERTPTIGKATPTPGPNDEFDADLEADGCSADNIPRLKAKWNTPSGDNCKISIEENSDKEDKQKAERFDCGEENLIYTSLPREGGEDLKSETAYTLTVKVGDQEKEAKATTAKCSGKPTATPKDGATNTPTPRNGATATPTPRGGSGTNLEKPKLGNHSCIYTDPNNTKVKITWGGNDGIENVVYKLEYTSSTGAKNTVNDITKREETLERIQKGIKYTYKITATKTGATSQTVDSTFTCAAPTATRAPTATPKPGTPTPTKGPDVPGAGTFNPNATPTNCPGRVCP